MGLAVVAVGVWLLGACSTQGAQTTDGGALTADRVGRLNEHLPASLRRRLARPDPGVVVKYSTWSVKSTVVYALRRMSRLYEVGADGVGAFRRPYRAATGSRSIRQGPISEPRTVYLAFETRPVGDAWSGERSDRRSLGRGRVAPRLVHVYYPTVSPTRKAEQLRDKSIGARAAMAPEGNYLHIVAAQRPSKTVTPLGAKTLQRLRRRLRDPPPPRGDATLTRARRAFFESRGRTAVYATRRAYCRWRAFRASARRPAPNASRPDGCADPSIRDATVTVHHKCRASDGARPDADRPRDCDSRTVTTAP